MAETLKQTADRLADDLAESLCSSAIEGWPVHTRKALREAVRAALAEPTEEMKTAGCVAISDIYRRDGGWCGLKVAQDQMIATWDAMAAERLKELG